jgi:hypothetical protein
VPEVVADSKSASNGRRRLPWSVRTDPRQIPHGLGGLVISGEDAPFFGFHDFDPVVDVAGMIRPQDGVEDSIPVLRSNDRIIGME